MLLRVTDIGKIPSRLEGFPVRSAGRITVHILNREYQPWKEKRKKRKKERVESPKGFTHAGDLISRLQCTGLLVRVLHGLLK